MRGVRDADKEENNLQYQTYYRNEYIREKKEKTNTDLMLGTKENKKYIIETQGKTTSTT